MQNLKIFTASCKGLLGHISMTECDIPILLRGCGVPTSLVKPYVVYHVLEIWCYVLDSAMDRAGAKCSI